MSNLIKIENMTKIYKMGNEEVRALDGINLEIEEREFVAIIGASGSGKSTLMNMIGCLDIPDGGKYYIEDNDISKLTDIELAKFRGKKIGFVFQQFNLLAKYSALENVALPAMYIGTRSTNRKSQAKKSLELVGLGDRTNHRPAELSGGQQQRVAIARSLINNPPIILADEPTGNLDSKSSLEIMNIFENLHEQGNTVILITHEKEIAERASRVITMSDGKIIKDERSSKCIS